MNRRWRLRLYWVSTFAWAFFLSRGAFAMLLNVSDVIAQSCNPCPPTGMARRAQRQRHHENDVGQLEATRA